LTGRPWIPSQAEDPTLVTPHQNHHTSTRGRDSLGFIMGHHCSPHSASHYQRESTISVSSFPVPTWGYKPQERICQRAGSQSSRLRAEVRPPTWGEKSREDMNWGYPYASFSFLPSFLSLFSVMGIEPKASGLLSKCSPTEPYPQSPQ
jgi:hypothetical protein